MDEKNQYAKKQLMALAQDISGQLRNVKWTNDDNDYDEEHKRGLREAFLKVSNMIFERCEELTGEQK